MLKIFQRPDRWIVVLFWHGDLSFWPIFIIFGMVGIMDLMMKWTKDETCRANIH